MAVPSYQRTKPKRLLALLSESLRGVSQQSRREMLR